MLCAATRCATSSPPKTSTTFCDRRLVHDPLREHRPQDAVHHVIQARHRHLAALDRLLQRLAEELAAGLLLVEARHARP